jgi:signal transduction histidine kinase
LNCRVDHKPATGATAASADLNSGELPRRVTAALAHNVNNALAAVIGHLELALREGDLEGLHHDRLTQALSCALRASDRVRCMVAFVRRPEASLAEALCLRGAAEQAACRAAAENPDLCVELQGPESPCPVRANETLLHLVLEQLICNAVEAMHSGGTLTLCAWDEGPRRCLSVGDTGHGLSAEVRRRLFEPFFTTKSHGHLGLGLALCRDVIEAGGGAVHVTSAEGQGTTVTLSFPPPEEPRDPLPAPAETFAI